MHEHTLVELQRALAAGELSSASLTEHYLQRIERYNPTLNALISVDAEAALDAAKASDRRRADGQAGPLEGLPLVHKDIFCTTELTTTCGSRMLDGYRSPIEAGVVTRLREAGAVLLGKANMDEFAMGSSNETSHFGAVANPWNLDCVPGGSSGGSAAAVAGGLTPAATGTDTGGSIRLPAAYCGLTGLKPTYGRVSRYGMVAFASSLDQGGPLARSAEDCALLLGSMAGFDERDSTSSEVAVPDYLAALESVDLQGLRVGVPQEYFGEGLDAAVAAEVESALSALESLGAVRVPIHLPNQRLCIPSYYVIAPAEASSNLSRFDGVRFGHRCADPTDIEDLYKRSRAEGFGPEVRRRILIGTYALSAGYYDAYYLKAQQVRRLVSEDFSRAFESVDVIAGPTAPGVAFARGAKLDDPVSMYLIDLYTVSANLSGLPALSMPIGFADALPVGLQLVAPAFEESRLLGIAHAYQRDTDFHRRLPPELSPEQH